jgi:hypothetical protein
VTMTTKPGAPDAGDAAMGPRPGSAAGVLAVIRIACPEPSGRPASPGRGADPGGYCLGDVAIRVE